MKCQMISLSLMVCCTMLVALPAIADPTGLAPNCRIGGRCDHVISMMLKHGVNNRFDRSEASRLLHSTSIIPTGLPLCELGDLELVQVSQLSTAPNCGPRVAVQLMNRSNRKVGNFHVTAVAVFGQIRPDSPCVTTEVTELEAGAIVEVTLQLPVEAYAMGNRNGQPLAFQTLVIAIDSFDAMIESDESNNIRAIGASELPEVQSVAVTQAVELLQADEPVSTNVVTPQSPREVDSPVERPDLEQPTPDSLRAAIRMLALEPTTTAQASTSN